MKRFLGMAAFLVLTGQSLAGNRVEADPNKLYAITPEVGPWVISAASYMGPDARQLAREVVYQLRRRDNMPAWFFDYSEQERKELADYLKGRERGGKIRIQDQCGVLIGGYPDADSARKALADIRKLKAPELDKKAFEATVNPGDPTHGVYYINPFLNAFVTRNPSMAHAQQAEAPDPALKLLNEGEEFSLLKNRHPLSLAVKTYMGVSALNSNVAGPSLWSKLSFGKNSQEVMSAGGRTAHEMAGALRKLGFDAYVLHTRKESIVAIGGFDDPKDPKIQETITKLGRLRDENIKRQRSDPFQLVLFPMLMRVPKE
jgi:hypothetical protein